MPLSTLPESVNLQKIPPDKRKAPFPITGKRA
jgi:hypothetical protein